MSDATSKPAKAKAAKTKPASDSPKPAETTAETVATPAPAAEGGSVQPVRATGSADQDVTIIDAPAPAEGAPPEVRGKQGYVILDEANVLLGGDPVFVGIDLGREEFPANTPQVIRTTGEDRSDGLLMAPGFTFPRAADGPTASPPEPLIRRFPVVCNVVTNKKWIAPGNFASVDRARFDELKASGAFVAGTHWEDGEPDVDGLIGGLAR